MMLRLHYGQWNYHRKCESDDLYNEKYNLAEDLGLLYCFGWLPFLLKLLSLRDCFSLVHVVKAVWEQSE